MDVTIVADPGPVGGIGDISIHAPPTIPESIIRSFIYLQAGEPYSPEALERTKTSVRSIPAVGSARFTEKSFLDPHSDLPLDLEVAGRPEHALGASAQYSTIDGPVGQVYWEDRNLFGGAEYLRLQGDLLYAPNTPGALSSAGALGNTDIGGRIAAHFIEPALGGTRNDLLVDAKAERVGTSYGNFVGYTVDDTDFTAALRHRFSDQLSLQAGLEAQRGISTDVLGAVDYDLIGVPFSLNYDTTDDKLDPKRGLRVLAQFADYPKFLDSSLDLFTGRASVSAYRSLDESSRFILAGRLEAAGETGAALAEIPANLRLYAGGGGSVRGYPYYSLGPLGPGNEVVGGRSLVDGSLELRAKVTDTIGIVPFFDAGDAFANNWPDFSAPLRMAAGLGLRYYTSFGPLRLDLAAPLNPRPGDPRFAAYVSIGQAF
jgi:translocation and assembly module TamA